MANPRRFRPAHLIALVLIAPPIYKLAEWAWPASGPKKASVGAVAAGRDLFNHDWEVNDPLSSGDGLGPVFNARSCVACHSQGGPGGGGPVEHNVTVYGLSPAVQPKDRQIPPIGVVHSHAIKPEFQERLNPRRLPGLPGTPSVPLEQFSLTDRSRVLFPTGVSVTQRNTPALFGDGLLDAIPEDALHAEQRRNSDRRPPCPRPQQGQGLEDPGESRQAPERPTRPIRLEGGIRLARRLRPGRLRQRVGPLQPHPTAGHLARQA